MDDILLILIGAVINGVCLMIGMVLGAHLTSWKLETKGRKLINEATEKIKASEDAKNLAVILVKLKELLESDEAKGLLVKLTKALDEFAGTETGKMFEMPKKEVK